MSEELKKMLEDKSQWYTELYPKWRKTRLVYKGEDDVHAAGEELLPRLPSQDDDKYNSYVERTRFLNAFKGTIKGLEGTVKRKEPVISIGTIKEYESDIDTAGTTIKEYGEKILHEGGKIGFCATLVDYNDSDSGEELTIKQAEEKNLRPKLCFYISDNVYKIRYGVVGGKKVKTMVVLKEKYKKAKNEFVNEEFDQWRVLRLNEKGNYEQQLYKEIKNGSIEPQEAIVIEMNGKPLTEIPFYIHGEIEEPPLYDLVTTNIKHYQLKADHNHGLHFIGLPTAYRIGVPPDNELPKSIGAQIVWDIENDKAKVGFLEFEGKGMGSIEHELEVLKDDMAFLGADMLATDDMVNETATKATYRNFSKTSTLVDIVNGLSDSFTKALKFFALWAGKEDSEIEYMFNNDFEITKLTAQDILARVQGWQMGGYSKRSLHQQLKKGEVEIVGETFEEEEELINKGE